jgi:hypothetical protein
MELWTFDAVRVTAIIALVQQITQVIKQAIERGEAWTGAPAWLKKILTWWAHGWGPRVLLAIVSLTAVLLPQIVADGVLTMPELGDILQALGIGAGATILHWAGRWKWPWKLLSK